MTSVSLGEVAETVMGQAPPGKACNKEGKGTVFVKAGEFDVRFPIVREWTTEPLKLARPGDVLVCVVGATSGKVNQAIDCAIGRSVAAVRPRNGKLDSGYLYHYLSDKTQALRARSQGLAQGVITREMLHDLEIPLPPLEEQKRIAAILDQADELRRLRQRAIDRLNQLGQSIFHEMFGDGILSKKWPIEQLQEVVKTGTIVTYGIVQAGEEFDGGIPYIRTGDIVAGEIQTTQLRRTDPVIAARFERSRVDAGDIVMSIRATVGTTATVPKELEGANLTQGTARIAPGDKSRKEFLVEYLRSPNVQNWIARQVKGATFREITLGRLRELEVSLPPLPLQAEFGRRLAQLDSLRSLAALHQRTAANFFTSLQHRAFRGEL